MSRQLLSLLVILLLDAFSPFALVAQQGPFPVPAGLQGAVDFWKQVFTRHGYGEVLLFDPIDPATIYRVLRAGETEQGRAWVGNERARASARSTISSTTRAGCEANAAPRNRSAMG